MITEQTIHDLLQKFQRYHQITVHWKYFNNVEELF